VLQRAGLDPTVVIGGKLNSLGSSARLGSSDVLVAEADESDGSFLMLTPTIAVITNIDDEHMDHYGTMARLEDAFVGLRQPRAVLRHGGGLQRRPARRGDAAAPDQARGHLRVQGPGRLHAPRPAPRRARTRTFTCARAARTLGEFTLHMPGVHNVLNALATIAVCDEYRRSTAAVTRAALAEFTGVQRRFTVRGTAGGVMVVDDYGHHPTEIRATLAGARTSYPERRLVAVFQPHRYSRVRDHLEGFAACLDARRRGGADRHLRGRRGADRRGVDRAAAAS
jgi:UDP-N-acetylmuramate--alanine ligase